MKLWSMLIMINLGKEIKFLDNQQNKYFLNEVMINTDNDNLYGKDFKYRI